MSNETEPKLTVVPGVTENGNVVVLHPDNYTALGAALGVPSPDDAFKKLADAFGIDLGMPNEMTTVGIESVRVRDELGLKLDPQLYASPKCNNCYGRGVVIHHKPIPAEIVAAMVRKNPANEASFIRTEKRGVVKYSVTAQAKCGCTETKYGHQRRLVALARERLSRRDSVAQKEP